LDKTLVDQRERFLFETVPSEHVGLNMPEMC